VVRATRKNSYTSFSSRTNTPVFLLLVLFFFLGFFISLRFSVPGVVVYLGLWLVSYIVIYAGTCRNCVYYGRRCPIPLEGSCVHHFLKKGEKPFGRSALFGAMVAYLLRILVPSFIIFYSQWLWLGIAYFGIFVLFWVIHLRVTGCPNCVNIDCPLNPDYSER
jgi:hypothetical protein